MEIAKKSLYRLDSDVAMVGLFFASAHLAGSKRFIEVFPTANRQGLMFAAATSSLGLGGSKFLTNQVGLKKKTPLYLVYKSMIVVAAALFTTTWVADKFGREAKILSQGVNKFARVTTGVIVGAHCTRYLRPMPGKKVDLDKLESDLQTLEAVPHSEWQMSDGVNAFNPDSVLDMVGDENVICLGKGGTEALYKGLFTLKGKAMVSNSVKKNAVRRIDQYSGWSSGDVREDAVKWYLNKILLYLLAKKAAFQRDPDQTSKKRKELMELIDKVMVRIEDAHRGCIDQTTIQLEWLMIEIVDDFGLSEIEKTVAVQIRKYRAALIEKCVAVTNEEHAADLGVDLTNSITRALGLPITRATKHGAKHNIYSWINFQRAKANFFAQYDPVGHLFMLTDLTAITKSKTTVYANDSKTQRLSNSMNEWFRKKVFVGLSDSAEEKIESILGADFLCSFERKDSAVLYYLFKNGLITV